MNMTLQDVGILFAVVASILGWIYQLGYSSARLHRNEQDIAELKRKQDERIGALEEKIGAGLQRIYDKLDKLPCKNAGWKPGDC
jgi:hypothetical protein